MEVRLPVSVVVAFLLLAGVLACASSGGKAPSAAGSSAPSSEATSAPSGGEGGEKAAPSGGETPSAGEAATGPEAPSAPPGTAAGEGSGSEGASPEAGAARQSLQPVPASDQEREFGKTFQPLADKFAFTQYVQATRRGNELVYEYLPEGETLDDWHYLGIVMLFPVARTWEEAEEIMPKFVQAFLQGRPGVNEVQTIAGEHTKLTYIDFDLPTTGKPLHVLAAVWQVIPGAITVFEAQRRSGRFEDGQVEQFKEVANQLAAQAGARLAPQQGASGGDASGAQSGASGGAKGAKDAK